VGLARLALFSVELSSDASAPAIPLLVARLTCRSLPVAGSRPMSTLTSHRFGPTSRIPFSIWTRSNVTAAPEGWFLIGW
jgi:hypothetical protein